MRDIVAAVAEQQDELASLLRSLDDAGWATPSACDGWSVADVVLHLAQTNEMATGSAQDRFAEVTARLSEGLAPAADVDEGADLMVAKERGTGFAEIDARWQRSCADLRAALLARQPGDRLTWVAGELAARTLGTTRLAETWIHTGDVAYGLEVELEPTDRLWHIARLAWRTLPYAFQRAGAEPPGPVAFRLVGPRGTAWDFGDGDAPTVITGDAHELCQVAAQRRSATETALTGTGPDADRVLELVRTFA